MAVEKLILRSILYGADKIPDSWFEKLPGGYYKDAQGKPHKIGEKDDKNNSSASKKEGRRAEYNDFYPERHASERGRQRQKDRIRGRSSYDGGADDNYYRYGGDGRPHRSNSHRRRRSVDGDRYGYEDGHRRGRRGDQERRPRESYDDDRHRGAASPTSQDIDYGRRRSAPYIDKPRNRPELRPFDADPFVAAAAAEAGRAAAAPLSPRRKHPTQMPDQPTPPPSRNGDISNGYVPYAHIYGNASPQHSSHSDSRPPSSHNAARFETHSSASPVNPPLQGYQPAPNGSDVGARSEYGSRAEIIPQDACNMNGYRNERVNGYDARDDSRHSPRERGNDGGRSKSERYVDSRKPTFNEPGDVQRRSEYDRNWASNRGTLKRARDDAYYSD